MATILPTTTTGSILNENAMMEMMKTKLLMDMISNFGNTDDTLWGMVIKFLLVMLVQISIKSGLDLINYGKKKLSTFSIGIVTDTSRKFKYEMMIENSYYRDLLSSQLAKAEVLNRKNLTVLRDSEYASIYYLFDELKGSKQYLFIQDGGALIPLKRIRLNHYIYYSVSKTAVVSMLCDTNNQDLVNYLDELDKNYKKLHTVQKRRICYTKDGKDTISKFMQTSIDMKNVFIEQKEKVLQIVDKFKDWQWYENKGIPRHLTFMLSGPPGTSKTTFIKALSSYMDRNVVFIDCATDLKTKKSLRSLFDLHSAKSIIVLEDFDRIPSILIKNGEEKFSTCEEDINNRKKQDHLQRLFDTYVKCHDATEKENLLKLYNAEIVKQSTNEDLDLSFVLNMLDGIQEYPGRFIIMTANHPERIDQALLRPGRIDYVVEFKCASKKIIRQILCFFFDLSQEELPDMVAVKDYKFTHAQIYAVCKKHDNVVKVVHELSNSFLDLSSVKI
jgi:hypothetical protein